MTNQTWNIPRWTILLVAGLLSSIVANHPAQAQCLFGMSRPAFSVDIRNAEFVVLAEFIHSTPVLDPGTERLSIFQVRRVLKGSAEAHPNQIISVNLRCAGNIGDACLVLARKSDAAGVEWADILATSDLRLGYFARVADYERDEMQRLNYFLPSLEPLKSFDHFEAVKEFAQTKMDDLVRFAPQLPRMKLRQWIRDPKTDVSDVSEFGWLLGLCGTDVDAKFLDEMIFHHPRAIAAAAVLKQKESADADELTPVEVLETPEDEPFDETLLMYEGLVKGYFYLRGVRGLDHLEERILNNSQESRGRKYVVIDAAESMSEIAKDRIPATRLKLQMLRLLDRPDFARLAILTFLQKQDWTLQDKIAAIYSKEEFNTPRIHSAIVEYLLGSAGQNKDVKSPSPSSVEDAQKATRHLERIRRLDPEVFTEFE